MELEAYTPQLAPPKVGVLVFQVQLGLVSEVFFSKGRIFNPFSWNNSPHLTRSISIEVFTWIVHCGD